MMMTQIQCLPVVGSFSFFRPPVNSQAASTPMSTSRTMPLTCPPPAHLAGALNKPTWILSRYDGCWRWLHDRDDTPWYPRTRLFHQTQPGDWEEVIERVRIALEQWPACERTPA